MVCGHSLKDLETLWCGCSVANRDVGGQEVEGLQFRGSRAYETGSSVVPQNHF